MNAVIEIGYQDMLADRIVPAKKAFGNSDRLKKAFCNANMKKRLGGLIFCEKENLLKKIGNFLEVR